MRNARHACSFTGVLLQMHTHPHPQGRLGMMLRSVSALAWLLLLTAGCADGREAPATAAAVRVPPVVTPTGVALPPTARVGTHVDTFHGVAVPDPYRWMEDTTAPDTRAWVAAQERYADEVLARGVGQDSLSAMYANAFRDAPTLGRVLETPNGLTMTRWLGDSPSLFVAARDASAERMLISAEQMLQAFKVQLRLRQIMPSPTGRFLALGTTASGDSGAAVAILNGVTGAVLADRIPDLFTTPGDNQYRVTWMPADSAAPAFLYPRLWPESERGPQADRLARARIFLHRLGTPQSADVAVFGYGVSPAVPMAPEDVATRVLATPGSRWLIGSVFRSKASGRDDFAARRTAGDSVVPSWVPLVGTNDRAGYPQLLGDTVYAIMRLDADRGRIARRVLGDGPTPSGGWETVVAERRGVITAFSVVRDALYFTERDAGALSLYVLPPGATTPRLVTLPLTGTVAFRPRSGLLDGVLVSVESWATPPRYFSVSRAGTIVEALSIDDGAKATVSSTLVSDRIEAKSRDGTLVPVSLVYDPATFPAGRLDGSAPLMIEAYGGFGDETDASYAPTIQVWTALGGVYAYAHVRGGGERGDAWHRAAMREHKIRSVEDVIGTAEALIARGFSAPGRVAFQGISFGAVLAGLVPLSRPDLFGAIVYDVGGPDEVRAAALDPSAARNIAEIGDVDTPEGIRSLMAASPYHTVPSRLAHPAMLIHSANDDYNFGTEMLVAKYVARLQATNAGARPVVWKRTDGGHRWLSSLSPEWAARQTAFLLWQLGDPRYQPSAKGR